MKNNLGNTMRVIHRYLGFFLAGIMAMYALSGIIMVFRQTDFLKQEKMVESKLSAQLSAEEVGKELKIRDFKVVKDEGDILTFAQGQYNKTTGAATVTVKELPFILDKMTKMHKATTKSPLYFLNLFFGVALLFFVVSSFFMFIPSTSVFRKGMYFTLAGIILTLIMLFV